MRLVPVIGVVDVDEIADRRNRRTTTPPEPAEEDVPAPMSVAKTQMSKLMPLNPTTEADIRRRELLEKEWAGQVQRMLDAGYVVLARTRTDDPRGGTYHRFNMYGRPTTGGTA